MSTTKPTTAPTTISAKTTVGATTGTAGTTASPVTYKPQVAGKRPPADEMPTQIFLDKKCGVEGTHDNFFEWCSDPKENKVEVLCEGIGGGVGACEFEANFIYDSRRNAIYEQPNDLFRAAANVSTTIATTIAPKTTISPNATTNGTTLEPVDATTPVPVEVFRYPSALHYKHRCMYGNDPNKATVWEDTVKINETIFDRITKTCYQEMYGAGGLPLWLIILIILIIVSVVIAASIIFWKRWLRRRVVGPAPGSKVSTIGSTWTSAPISNASSITSSFSKVSPKGSASVGGFSKGPSRVSSRASNRMTSRGTSGSHTGSFRSKAPSVRSGMTNRSRSSSHSRR